MLGKIRNVITHPCLIIGVCKMIAVSVVMSQLNYKDKTNE